MDSVDVYDYLTRGINPTGVRLQAGDVVFVPVHGGLAKLAGKVKRPAVYELKPNETLRDALQFAGGFDPRRRPGAGDHPPHASSRPPATDRAAPAW